MVVAFITYRDPVSLDMASTDWLPPDGEQVTAVKSRVPVATD